MSSKSPAERPSNFVINNRAGIDFGILGSRKNCCGESIRKTGDEELFKRLAKENIKVKGERFSDLRIKQAVDVGAEVLATSCPYCITHFEESRLALKDGEATETKDITEILQEVI